MVGDVLEDSCSELVWHPTYSARLSMKEFSYHPLIYTRHPSAYAFTILPMDYFIFSFTKTFVDFRFFEKLSNFPDFSDTPLDIFNLWQVNMKFYHILYIFCKFLLNIPKDAEKCIIFLIFWKHLIKTHTLKQIFQKTR